MTTFEKPLNFIWSKSSIGGHKFGATWPYKFWCAIMATQFGEYSVQPAGWLAPLIFLNIPERTAMGLDVGLWFNVMCLPFIIWAVDHNLGKVARDFLRHRSVQSCSAKVPWTKISQSYPNAPIVMKKGMHYITESGLMLLCGQSHCVKYFADVGTPHGEAIGNLINALHTVKNKRRTESPSAPNPNPPPSVRGVPPQDPAKRARWHVDAAAAQLRSSTGADLYDCFAAVLESKREVETLPPNVRTAVDKCAVKNKYVLKAVFQAVTESVAPSLWRVMLGKDSAVISYQAYVQLRKYKQCEFVEPPKDWIKDYCKLVCAQLGGFWIVRPLPGMTHSVIRRGTGTTREEREATLTDSDVIYARLEGVVKSHIINSIAEGHDLLPYRHGNSKKLVFKLAFDTTKTGGRDMYMLGVIPHQFPNAKKVQSAKNVLVVCLCRLDETEAIINNAHPELASTVRRLAEDGVQLDFHNGEMPVTIGVEFHVAADLKALWLCLGLPSFCCPFCMACEWSEMNAIHINYQKRELSGALGVPPENIHLCALHANLRIVERLLKNAAMSAYNRDAQDSVHRVAKLKRLLRKRLHRTKFVITAKLTEIVGDPDIMEDDDLYAVGDAAFGQNVQRAVTENRTVLKLSSLTGPQSTKILTDKIYVEITDLVEGSCICEERAREIAQLPVRMRQRSDPRCRRCLVLAVWQGFADDIAPLLGCIDTPPELQGDEASRKAALVVIQKRAKQWLTTYVLAFGQNVTPYVHIVGWHIAEMLGSRYHTIGQWSQQGFEACHKYIRYLFQHATSLGGGKGRASPLRQIIRHLFRLYWARVRLQLDGQKPSSLTGLRASLQQWFMQQATDVDNSFECLYPDRNYANYIARKCGGVFRRPKVATTSRERAIVLLNKTNQ